MVLGWLAVGLIFSQESIRYQIKEITEKAIRKQIEKSHMSESQAEQAIAAGEKFGEIGMKINAVVMPALIAWVTPFWWGLFLWLLGKFVFKSGLPFMKAVEVAGLASMIMVLDTIVRTLLIIVTGNIFAAPSPMLLLKGYDPENTVHVVLGLLNVMTFWGLAVKGIGLARLTNGSTTKAITWVTVIWAACTAVYVGAGAAMRAAFAHIQK
jgi:hypothetical protein